MKTPRCRSNRGCDERMQTEVAWTCGKKRRCRLCERMYSVGGGEEGACRLSEGDPRNTLSADMRLLKFDPRDVWNTA